MPRKEFVTRVIDGDTFATASRKKPVRLANVNAPEIDKRGGKTAKNTLEKMIGGEMVSVETVARDIYGRDIARVKVGTRSVNKAMADELK